MKILSKVVLHSQDLNSELLNRAPVPEPHIHFLLCIPPQSWAMWPLLVKWKTGADPWTDGRPALADLWRIIQRCFPAKRIPKNHRGSTPALKLKLLCLTLHVISSSPASGSFEERSVVYQQRTLPHWPLRFAILTSLFFRHAYKDCRRLIAIPFLAVTAANVSKLLEHKISSLE